MSTQGDDGGEIDIDVESYETEQLEALKERITQVVNSRMSENSEGDLFTTNGGDTRWTLIDTRYGVKGLVEVGSTACDEIKDIPDSYKDRVQNRFFGTKYDQDEKWDVDMASIPWEETGGWTGCTFNVDEDSIDLIHALTSVRVPVEMRPGDGSGDGEGEDEKSSQQETVVLIRKPDQNVVQAQVEMGDEGRRFNPTTEINDILESHFSFEVEDKEYMPKVQRGEWDGIVNVYNGAEYGHYQAPIGLTDGMAEVLEEEGYEVVIEGPEHGNEGADVSDLVEWVSPLDERHYQREAVDAIHSEKKGVINLPTGSGKTITLLKFVAEIGRRTVVFVHTRELLQQWAEEVRECLGIEPTLVGEGMVEEGDGAVTICIMQTLHSQGIDVIPENDFGVVCYDECIAEDAEIQTPDGSIRIEDIEVGDTVISSDNDGHLVEKDVTYKWDVGEREVVEIETTEGKLTCTPDHEVYGPGGTFHAGDLNEGQTIFTHDSMRDLRSGVREHVRASIPSVGGPRHVQTGGDLRVRGVRGSLRHEAKTDRTRDAPQIGDLHLPDVRDGVRNDVGTQVPSSVGASGNLRGSEGSRVRSGGLRMSKLWRDIRHVERAWWTRQHEPSSDGGGPLSGVPRDLRFGCRTRWSYIFEPQRRVGLLNVLKGGDATSSEYGGTGFSGSNESAEFVCEVRSPLDVRDMWWSESLSRSGPTPHQWGRHGRQTRKSGLPLFFMSQDASQQGVPQVRASDEEVVPRDVGDDSVGRATVTDVRPAGTERVYDIEVEDTHRFFADGLLVSNCHRTSAADTFHAIGQKIGAKYRVGLTATPWRKNSGEELKIEGAVGPVIHREEAPDLMDEGYLKDIRIEKLQNPTDPGKDLADIYSNDYHEARRKHIVYNELRNHRIAERAFEVAREGRSVIVNHAEVDPCLGGAHDDHEQYSTKGITHYVNEIAAKKGVSDEIEAAGVTSDVSNREELLERFADEDDPLKIVSSTLLQEGFDLPEVSAIVMAQAGKSETETIQTAGRALRPSGYDEALIIDVQDGGPFTTMDRQRIDTYKGYYGDDIDVRKA